jgi:TatA/E family protein of Tat protein translocase
VKFAVFQSFFSASDEYLRTHQSRVKEMFGLGFQEILLILVILFLLFGVKKLPEIGRGLGETMKEIGKIRNDRKAGKEKEKEDQKRNVISDIKKEVEEIPGLKEVKEVKEVADKIKSITRILK